LFVPAVPGAILGMLGYILARADLARMRTGSVDRKGRKATKEAEKMSLIGLVLSLITCFICAALALMAFLKDMLD
jgi:hypothetical protein